MNTTDSLSPDQDQVTLDKNCSYCLVRILDGEVEVITNFLDSSDFMDIMNVINNTDAILEVSCDSENVIPIKKAIASLKPNRPIMLPSDAARMKTV